MSISDIISPAKDNFVIYIYIYICPYFVIYFHRENKKDSFFSLSFLQSSAHFVYLLSSKSFRISVLKNEEII